MGFIKDNFWTENVQDLVHFSGITAKLFKGNGKMEQKMDMEFGNHQKVISIKDNGNSTDSTVKELISIA
jgi:hypothetical protein